MHEPDSSEEPPSELEAAESVAADVSSSPMLELLNEPESDLAESVRQLLAQRTYRQDAVASWSSFLR
ncbi:hypothetical protein DMB66_04970 [Actinoplanes sp. ATCC 53533]|uniref:hypothetical protein n=1 Tax=Actinoplanes sp. ATCC 53533 TaxID=1288362 RepID=UPI000F766CCF|nr:hypothetical protein [Actinoplanes sp. ATCC 53533]RSM72732.1 hypothetical protein DMB66_04970 [Actinoplanes sp. ATCC 53533]